MSTERLGGLSPRRKWVAILVSTVFVATATGAMVHAFVSIAEDQGPRPSLALGLALIPIAFMVLSFLSNNPRPGTVVAAMLLALAVGIPVAGIAQDVVTGTTAGFAAGGVVCLRPVLHHSRWPRIIAVVLLTAYVYVVVHAFTEVGGLMAAALLPFVVLGLADMAAEWKITYLAENADRETPSDG